MPPRRFTDEEEACIAAIYEAGHSARAIARVYPVSHHTVIVSALRRQGIVQRSPAERNRLYQLNPHVFDKIDDEPSAYWYGFIYADGYVHHRSLSLSLKGSDYRHLERLRTFLQSTAPITRCKRGVRKEYTTALLYVTHDHLADTLRRLGILPGRPEPQRICEFVPRGLFNHWLRGFFDGDGSARKRPALGFCGDPGLLAVIRKLLAEEVDTRPNLAITPHTVSKRTFYLTYSGRRVALRIADYLYKDATVWLPRKRKVIESWPEPTPRQRDEKGRWI